MKKFLTLSSLLFSFSLFAQYTPQEVKKFKITRLTTLAITKGDGTAQKNEKRYDENGNDTAEYNNGGLYRRTRYEYNSKGQVISRTRYDADGKATDTAIFSYKPDGSCIISNTDKNFGMTDLTYCEKSGKITKTVSPDKSERIYAYNAKGKLLNIRSGSADNSGVVTNVQYTYNAKGQAVRESSNGDYKWTSIYSYDAKGMITKVKKNSITDGVPDPEVIYTFEYEFRK